MGQQFVEPKALGKDRKESLQAQREGEAPAEPPLRDESSKTPPLGKS
jgi:hypothetical protein